jgi:hypothetical protein
MPNITAAKVIVTSIPMLGYSVIAWFALKTSPVLRWNCTRAFQ